ncbi:MAG: agmatine deiminase [Eubacterium sp.]|nr:agmatine deiminase [Eubacterium sp.]
MTLVNTNELNNSSLRFPGEFEPHKGTLMIWPERPGSWGKDSSKAEDAFAEIITKLLEVEDVYLVVSDKAAETVYNRFNKSTEAPHELSIFVYETDDSWARDVGPTFVFKNSERCGINWSFNAWGGVYDGLYASWDKDDLLAKNFTALLGDKMIDAAPFVLEGGSIHSDGEGTLMVTESCLLSKGRNPSLDKIQIEDTLKHYLGVEKVLWLPRGIYMDETNEHVDNVAAFIRPGEIVLAWTDNKDDPQYELSLQDYEYLMSETDAKGRKLKVHKLPIPDIPVICTAEDIDNYIFEEGEDEREVGERLAASYVNFYFANDCLLVPQFGGENTESDERAVKILQELCPDRKVIPIYARHILLGGGNIHCITQQIPFINK